MKNDALGDRMKAYEFAEAGRAAMPQLPLCIRLDGRCFHSFCKQLIKPFDTKLHDLMIEVTKMLVNETNAKIGYTQSDEISLVLHETNPKTELYFGGKYHKITSMLAALCSSLFNKLYPRYLGIGHTLVLFDCRAWNAPTLTEACNYLIWREADAKRNSISGAARAEFSHKELMGKSCNEMQEKLFAEKGINWNDYPSTFKRGTYIRRYKMFRTLTDEEREKIPEKHRPEADEVFKRSTIMDINFPKLTSITNREAVLFEGADPITDGD